MASGCYAWCWKDTGWDKRCFHGYFEWCHDFSILSIVFRQKYHKTLNTLAVSVCLERRTHVQFTLCLFLHPGTALLRMEQLDVVQTTRITLKRHRVFNTTKSATILSTSCPHTSSRWHCHAASYVIALSACPMERHSHLFSAFRSGSGSIKRVTACSAMHSGPSGDTKLSL